MENEHSRAIPKAAICHLSNCRSPVYFALHGGRERQVEHHDPSIVVRPQLGLHRLWQHLPKPGDEVFKFSLRGQQGRSKQLVEFRFLLKMGRLSFEHGAGHAELPVELESVVGTKGEVPCRWVMRGERMLEMRLQLERLHTPA